MLLTFYAGYLWILCHLCLSVLSTVLIMYDSGLSFCCNVHLPLSFSNSCAVTIISVRVNCAVSC